MATTSPSLDALRTGGLEETDPTIARLLEAELHRQRHELELIASENFTWPSVLEAVGSVGTNKYAEGDPGRRYYGGCSVVDEIETIAVERAKELFGAEHANVQPHSGANANMAAFLALLEPGDHLLVPDSVYGPTRAFCDGLLTRQGIVVEFYEPESERSRGVIGLGEPPVISPGAALSNAVCNALGVRVPVLPMTPQRVLEALEKAGRV